MSLKQHFQLMASYNQWMNAKIYQAAGQLNGSELAEERGAFFGSVLGTLNHIVVGDTIWLKHFAPVVLSIFAGSSRDAIPSPPEPDCFC